jgi:hypothetical protein
MSSRTVTTAKEVRGRSAASSEEFAAAQVARRLIVLDNGDEDGSFPLFQFDEHGALRRTVGDVVAIFRGHLSDDEMVIWFTTRNPLLRHQAAPLDVLGRMDSQIIRAAKVLVANSQY